jgi:hypothetical protein
MADITEALQQPGGNDKAAGLIAGYQQLSNDAVFPFTLYRRLVLPIDGYVFWVKASILPNYPQSRGALYAKFPMGTKMFDALNIQDPLTPVQLANYEFSADGSVHVSQELAQDTGATYVTQDVVFTTKNELTQFAAIAPDEMFIMTLPNGSQVAFGSQRMRYYLAGIWHYHGRAIYSALADQIVNDLNRINPDLQIVSNSLPFWLALSTPQVAVYPAKLSPKNLEPPYITANVKSTEGLGQTPYFDLTESQSQLVADEIEFEMIGLNNNAALDFQRAILRNSHYGNYGIMNIPVPVDEKVEQVEFQVIGQKKTMQLKVNYYQTRVRAMSQRFILQATVAFTPVPHNFSVPITA